MVILNGLPSRCKSIITALDAQSEDREFSTLKVVKSRLLQEKQRQRLQKSDSLETALIGSFIKQARVMQLQPFLSRSYCKHSGHAKDQCGYKHLSLIPTRINSRYYNDP